MPLRSSLTRLSGSTNLSIRLRSAWAGIAVVAGLFMVSATGCGGCDEASLACDSFGKNCQLCDGYGCRPVDPNTVGVGGAGGASSEGSVSGTGGSAPSCDPSQTTCPCGPKNACSNGLKCIDGLCLSGCDFTYECGPGKICANGQCTADCDEKKPCAVGQICKEGACLPDPSNPACGPSAPCQGGEVCANGVCTKGCNINTECPTGQICDAGKHACIPDPTPHTTCSQTIKCTGQGQICLNDGYCHYPCKDTSACQKIDARFVSCNGGICRTEEEIAPECTSDKPCPGDKDCISNKCL